jgi:hypothetical protein
VLWANQNLNQNQANRVEAGTTQQHHRTAGQNSMLSNQVNLTKHIMSLDEVEITDRTGNDLMWNNAKSPLNGQKFKTNVPGKG